MNPLGAFSLIFLNKCAKNLATFLCGPRQEMHSKSQRTIHAGARGHYIFEAEGTQ